jgi:hypothetical protein
LSSFSQPKHSERRIGGSAEQRHDTADSAAAPKRNHRDLERPTRERCDALPISVEKLLQA